MEKTYIILAGGIQSRWKEASSKMLVPVFNQQLIRRTCSLLKNNNVTPVIYSNDNEETPIQIFGKTGSNLYTQKPWAEIYGLRVLDNAKNILLDNIDKALQAPKEKKKIWDLYSVLLGMAPATKPVLSYPKRKIFVEILDWSDDIDTPEEYHNIIRMLNYLSCNPFLNPNFI